ncbi:MAG: ABC transporter ATP-binding protein [Candidatus Harrisonbacteria bacterium]|nr:ABC transporter ATP-binding protein [Candidatus Harrisonbacteria bacterium]
MEPIIKVENISKTYQEEDVATHALSGINFTIQKGEFVAIMGPSGSGKSTLLNILGLLERQSSGTYQFLSHLSSEYDDQEAAKIRNEKIGFVFQSFNLLSRESVLSNVKMPLVYSKITNEAERTRRAEKAIRAVGLSHRINFEAGKLSGGEKQRVAIARALVNEPEVIFADEPTGNLDSKSGETVMKIIQTLNDKLGRTVILITHETSTAEHADRIIFIKDGKVADEKKIKKKRRANEGFIK